MDVKILIHMVLVITISMIYLTEIFLNGSMFHVSRVLFLMVWTNSSISGMSSSLPTVLILIMM